VVIDGARHGRAHGRQHLYRRHHARQRHARSQPRPARRQRCDQFRRHGTLPSTRRPCRRRFRQPDLWLRQGDEVDLKALPFVTGSTTASLGTSGSLAVGDGRHDRHADPRRRRVPDRVLRRSATEEAAPSSSRTRAPFRGDRDADQPRAERGDRTARRSRAGRPECRRHDQQWEYRPRRGAGRRHRGVEFLPRPWPTAATRSSRARPTRPGRPARPR